MSKEVIYLYFPNKTRNNLKFSLIFLFLILPMLSNENNLTELNEEININELSNENNLSDLKEEINTNELSNENNLTESNEEININEFSNENNLKESNEEININEFSDENNPKESNEEINIKIELNEENNINEIFILIEGGNSKFLNETFNQVPTQVLLNGEEFDFQNFEIQLSQNETKEKHNITLRWNQKITDCSYMFYNLTNITFIDFSNFDFSQVTKTEMMFGQCINLEKIIFPENRTSTNFQDMNGMFYNCNNLKELNLSNFDLFNVNNINSIFEGCNSLLSLDLSNLDFIDISLSYNSAFINLTSLIFLNLSKTKLNNDDISDLFINATSLISLDLSYLKIDRADNMSNLFANFYNLIFLDLSNIKGENTKNMYGMFSNCSNLEILNLSNFNSSSVNNISNIFYGCFNLKTLDMSNFIINNIAYINDIFKDLINLENLSLNNAFFDTEDFSYLFHNLSKLSSLNLFNFTTNSLTNMEYMFANCNNLLDIDLSSIKTENVKNISFLFYNCNKLESLDLSYFNTSNVQNMISVFKGCNSLKYLNLSFWDFTKVILPLNIFSDISNSIKYIDLNNCNFSNLLDLSYLFYYLHTLIPLDLSFCDISNAKNIELFFGNCKLLKSLNLSNFSTNNVEKMTGMFYNCESIQNLDLSDFNTDNVKNMDYMFYNCGNLTSLDISNFNTENVESMEKMFYGCFSMQYLNLSLFNTSNVKNMNSMFYECNSLTNLDLPLLNFSSLINIEYIFYNCYNILSLNLESINADKIESLEGLFYNCKKLIYLNISHFYTPFVTNMKNVFFNCEELISIDLSNLNFPKYVKANNMFNGCLKIKEIIFNDSNVLYFLNMENMFKNCQELISFNLSNFNTEMVENMDYMFYNCMQLENLNFSFFDTESATNFNYMFYNCKKLVSLDLSNFNTSKLSNIDSIFYGCDSLQYLDLSNWDFKYISFSKDIFNNLISLNFLKLSNVDTHLTNIRYLFSSLSYIISLDLSNFETSNVSDMYGLFAYSTKLSSLNLYNFKTNNVQIMWYMFDGCTSLTSLDLSSFDTSQVTDFDQMFRNLYSLNYLKLNFNLQKMQYHSDTFYQTNNFHYCINDESNMIYFYNLISSLYNTKRDCSKNCYSDKRFLHIDTNKCLPDCSNNITHNFTYNENCVTNCPRKTYLNPNYYNIPNLCEDLYCDYYYNFEQNECLNEIPEGYFLNNSYEKTIDKCHDDCRECDEKASLNNTNCKSCFPDKYLFFGNCVDNCSDGYYSDDNDPSKKICKCPDISCLSCSLESLSLNLCISCNDNYYPIFIKNNNNNLYNNYYKCSNNIEGYYFDSNDLFYKKCYETCKNCNEKGDDMNNNCLECKSNYTFKYDFPNDTNCYLICNNNYFYYFDNELNYHCVENCPFEFNKQIESKRRCIDECKNDNIYKYEYENKCYEKCPPKTKNDNFLCILNCSFYYNFNQTDCIEEIPEGYFLNDSNKKTIDKCHSNCRTCDKTWTNNNENCKSCYPDKYLYYGNCIDNCPNGFYSDTDDKSIKICKCINQKCLSCPLENITLCFSCNENYYQIYNDSSNIFPYVNCYNNPKGYYLDINDKFYKQCYLSCISCKRSGDIKNNNCLECADNYAKKDDYLNDNNCYEICPFYYYFDYEQNYFCTKEKKCPETFNKAIDEKNKCVDNCQLDNKYKFEFKKKCYEECPTNTINNNYYCEILCPEDFPYEIKETQECITNCSFNDLLNQKCILNNQNSQKVKKEEQNNIANNIQENIISGGINISSLDNGEDTTIKTKETSFTITTTENQKKNANKNETSIDLGDCENKLKEFYNIDKNKSLIIFKVEVLKEGMKIPKIEYEVYYPLKGEGGHPERLNLSVCQGTKIDLQIPVSVDENNLEKYDTKSDYYNDKCYASTSESGIDISLNDRKNEFIENNLTLCEEDCEFNGYDQTTKKALCSCNVKISLPIISEITIDKQRLYDSFADIKNIANLDLMKCYDTLFTKSGLKNNYGCYILIASILSVIICIIIYFSKENKNIKEILDKIILYKTNTEKLKLVKKRYSQIININKRKSKIDGIKDDEIQINKIINKKSSKKGWNSKVEEIKLKNSKQNNDIQNINYKNKKIKRKSRIFENKKNNPENIINNNFSIYLKKKDKNGDNKKRKSIKNPPKKRLSLFQKNDNNIEQIIKNIKKSDTKSNKKMIKELEEKRKKLKENEEIMNLNDYELNNLEYKQALKIDKRTFSQYYCSLIRTKHILIFSIFPFKDYNSRAIKISMFILSFSISFTVNALFFSDSTMHQIYVDNGSFNFIYHIPQIIFSWLISAFLNSLIRILALTEKNILRVKQEKNRVKLSELGKIETKNIFYKALLFFLISFIILGICWYYLSCFCCIYKNTQLHLIKDTLISFGMSLLYPFGIYLIPGIFRIPSLRAKKNDKTTMYKFSKIIQFF